MRSTKILDSSAIIAFVKDMDYPEGITKLSKHYELIVPEGVANEIVKPPGKKIFQKLVAQKSIKIVKADQEKTKQIHVDCMPLHKGECEIIAVMQGYPDKNDVCIVSDDKRVKNIFKEYKFKWTQKLLTIMRQKGLIDTQTLDSLNERLAKSAFYTKRRNT